MTEFGEERERRERAQAPEASDAVHLRSTFHRSVDEGVVRTNRTWQSLLATGMVGGMDVSIGVLAMLVVIQTTGSAMLGALAFSIGFIALTLGKSELFTENFLVPVAAVAAAAASMPSLLRLWAGTFVMNLVGGWLVGWLIVWGLPPVHDVAIELGRSFADKPWHELTALGVMAGAAITLMTWMQQGASSDFSRIVAAVVVAFVLAAAHLNHVVVAAIEMFVALHTGDAPFGYDAVGRVAGIAVVSNIAGGLVLVTVLRLAQVGRREIEAERHRPRSPDARQRAREEDEEEEKLEE